MSVRTLKRRVSQLEKKLADKMDDAKDLKSRMSESDGLDDKVTEDLALTRMKAEVIRDALDKAKDDLKSEEARIKSSDYKDAVKKMNNIKSDNKKTVKVIDEKVQDLMLLIDSLQKSCKDYDRLRRQVSDEISPYGLFYTYGWIVLLKNHLEDLSHDYIYQSR